MTRPDLPVCAVAAQTVEAIDSERDILQAELDSKAETVANLTEELELGHQQADDANRQAALHWSQMYGLCSYGSMVTTTLREFDTIAFSGSCLQTDFATAICLACGKVPHNCLIYKQAEMEWLLALHTSMLLFIGNSAPQHN